MDLCNSPEEWFAVARQHREAAVLSHSHRLVVPAYSAAGLAVECALKGAVMRSERWNRWPDRRDRRDIYSHDLRVLLRLSRMEVRVQAESAALTEIGEAWMMAEDWTLASRYAHKMKIRDARDLVYAVSEAGGTGLVEWIVLNP